MKQRMPKTKYIELKQGITFKVTNSKHYVLEIHMPQYSKDM